MLVESLKSDLSSKSGTSATVQSQEKQIKDLQAEVAAQTAKLVALEAQKQELVGKMAAERARLDEQRADLSRDIEHLKTAAASHAVLMKDAEKKAAEQKALIAELHDKVRTQHEENSALRLQNKQFRQQTDEAKREHDDTQDAMERLLEERGELQVRIGELEQLQSQSRDQNVAQLTAEVANLRKSVGELRKERDALADRLKQREASATALINELEGRVKTQAADLQEKNARITGLVNAKAKLEENHTLQVNEIAALKKAARKTLTPADAAAIAAANANASPAAVSAEDQRELGELLAKLREETEAFAKLLTEEPDIGVEVRCFLAVPCRLKFRVLQGEKWAADMSISCKDLVAVRHWLSKADPQVVVIERADGRDKVIGRTERKVYAVLRVRAFLSDRVLGAATTRTRRSRRRST